MRRGLMGAAAVMVLTACGSAGQPTPAPTVTVTASPAALAPTATPTESPALAAGSPHVDAACAYVREADDDLMGIPDVDGPQFNPKFSHAAVALLKAASAALDSGNPAAQQVATENYALTQDPSLLFNAAPTYRLDRAFHAFC